MADKAVTPAKVMHSIGCMRLAARIRDLVEDGWLIDSEVVTGPGGRRYARYFMPTPEFAE